MENEQRIVTEKANSFSGRYGKAGTEVKIYFDTEEQLIAGIDTVIKGVIHFNKKVEELNNEQPETHD